VIDDFYEFNDLNDFNGFNEFSHFLINDFDDFYALLLTADYHPFPTKIVVF